MEGFMLLLFIYVLFSCLIGFITGLSGALDGWGFCTPKVIIKRIKDMNKIQIYHILYVFGIPALIIYYVCFAIGTILIKIGTITIYRRKI